MKKCVRTQDQNQRFFVSNLFNYFDPPNADSLLPGILKPRIIWILLLDGIEITFKFSFIFYKMKSAFFCKTFTYYKLNYFTWQHEFKWNLNEYYSKVYFSNNINNVYIKKQNQCYHWLSICSLTYSIWFISFYEVTLWSLLDV